MEQDDKVCRIKKIGICEGGIYYEYRALAMWSFGYSICDYRSVICNIYDKLVDCLEKCLIYRHIRRFAD